MSGRPLTGRERQAQARDAVATIRQLVSEASGELSAMGLALEPTANVMDRIVTLAAGTAHLLRTGMLDAPEDGLAEVYKILNGESWSADHLDAIAALLRRNGFVIHGPEEG